MCVSVSASYQLDNGIPIESWFEDRDDMELLKLIPFLEELQVMSRMNRPNMVIDAHDPFTHTDIIHSLVQVVDDVRPLIRATYQSFKLVEDS